VIRDEVAGGAVVRYLVGQEGRGVVGVLALLAIAVAMGGYFAFAAVQGDHGLLRRVQIAADSDTLRAERDRLAAELASLENLTRRLSDGWLDVDLLDERARDMLGALRPDEAVLR
jgi:cell division protein FtsB